MVNQEKLVYYYELYYLCFISYNAVTNRNVISLRKSKISIKLSRKSKHIVLKRTNTIFERRSLGLYISNSFHYTKTGKILSNQLFSILSSTYTILETKIKKEFH